MPPYPNFKFTLWKGVINDARDVSDSLYREVYEKAKLVLKDIAVKENVLFIDNENYLNTVGKNEDMFYDSIHLSPQGNRAVAESMAKELIPFIENKHKNIVKNAGKKGEILK